MKGPPLPPPRVPTLQAALDAAAQSDAGLTFLDPGAHATEVPFRAVRDRARAVAAGLRARGVASGDAVALVLPTSPDFVIAFFAALQAGAVPVPLYPPLRLGRLGEYQAATARMLATVAARLVVTDRRAGALLGPAVERARPPLGWATVADLEGSAAPWFETAADADDLALVQFSSGSTSDPKPVALRHRHVTAMLTALEQILPPERGAAQRGVSWLPLYHDMGLVGCLLLAVWVPGPLVLIPPEQFLARPALWLQAIAAHRATVSAAPAFAYSLCARRVRNEELAGCDLSSWQMALCGAEPIAPQVLAAFARRFAPFGFDARAWRPAYGLAEATLAVTVAPPDRELRCLGVDATALAASGHAVPGDRSLVSVGVPVAGAEVEVRRPDGTPAPDLQVGEITVRGPAVTDGAGALPAAGAARPDGSWLATGDLGFVADGELFVCGREKDLVIVRGANHAPQEFEECLDDVPGVRTGCAIAAGLVPDGAETEQLLLLVERARDAAGDDATLAAAIARAVLERTGIRPHTVRVLAPGTLPRTSSGKLRRGEAVRRFAAGELAPPAAAGAARLAFAAVRSALAFLRTGTRRVT